MVNEPKSSSNFRNSVDLSLGVGLSLGVTEPMIKKLVHSFYAIVREDPLIGPIFKQAIKNDWDEHLEIMCDFWSSVVLATRRYKGRPLLKHVNLPKLEREHFLRWLSIFEKNAYEVCNKEIAGFFVTRSQKIAKSLMLGINFYHNNTKI